VLERRLVGHLVELDDGDRAVVLPGDVGGDAEQRPFPFFAGVLGDGHQDLVAGDVVEGRLRPLDGLAADAPADHVGRGALAVDLLAGVEEVPEDRADRNDQGTDERDGSHESDEQDATEDADDLRPGVQRRLEGGS